MREKADQIVKQMQHWWNEDIRTHNSVSGLTRNQLLSEQDEMIKTENKTKKQLKK